MRGEATFQAKGETWVMRFGNNEFCTIEDKFDRPFAQVAAELDGDAFNFRTFRAIFAIGLKRKQPTVDDNIAGDIIDDLGMEEAVRMLGECIRSALPQKKAGEAGEETAAE